MIAAVPEIYVVIQDKDATALSDVVREALIPQYRTHVKLISDHKMATTQPNKQKKSIEEICSEIHPVGLRSDSTLIVDQFSTCGFSGAKTIEKKWLNSGFKSDSVKIYKGTRAIAERLKEWSERLSIHWRQHANREISKYNGKRISLDAWLDQFALLGSRKIGTKIAARIQVLRLNEIETNPFSPREADKVGQVQLSCYMSDADLGGSWVSIQEILTHSHPHGSVQAAVWDKDNSVVTLPDSNADEVVIYEDGLWSGSETFRRLEALNNFTKRYVIRLRFGIVTDFGLMAVRHAIRMLGLSGRIFIDAEGSKIIRFLPKTLPEELRTGGTRDMWKYFNELHRYVNPLAFEPTSDWTKEEMDLCKEIGAALVRCWALSRGKNEEEGKRMVEKFALGGGGFASTLLFDTSIPKVCLPLLWLNGNININGVHIDWRPLFIDSRRIFDNDILFSS